jgi:hypothetical protein
MMQQGGSTVAFGLLFDRFKVGKCLNKALEGQLRRAQQQVAAYKRRCQQLEVQRATAQAKAHRQLDSLHRKCQQLQAKLAASESKAQEEVAALQQRCQQQQAELAQQEVAAEAKQQQDGACIAALQQTCQQLQAELVEQQVAAEAKQQQDGACIMALQGQCVALGARLDHAQQQAYAAQQQCQQQHQVNHDLGLALQQAEQHTYAVQQQCQQLQQVNYGLGLALQQAGEMATNEQLYSAAQHIASQHMQIQQLQYDLAGYVAYAEGLLTLGSGLTQAMLADELCRPSIKVALASMPQDGSVASSMCTSILRAVKDADDIYSRPHWQQQQQAAAATPAAPQLLPWQPRTPSQSQHASGADRSSSSSVAPLALVQNSEAAAGGRSSHTQPQGPSSACLGRPSSTQNSGSEPVEPVWHSQVRWPPCAHIGVQHAASWCLSEARLAPKHILCW